MPYDDRMRSSSCSTTQFTYPPVPDSYGRIASQKLLTHSRSASYVTGSIAAASILNTYRAERLPPNAVSPSRTARYAPSSVNVGQKDSGEVFFGTYCPMT